MMVCFRVLSRFFHGDGDEGTDEEEFFRARESFCPLLSGRELGDPAAAAGFLGEATDEARTAALFLLSGGGSFTSYGCWNGGGSSGL
jgi:hypothetical protein